jgi:CRISPR type III-B/RAMP module RAMP protein Cmr6
MTDPPRPAPPPGHRPGLRRPQDQVPAAGPLRSVVALVRERRQDRETYRLGGASAPGHDSNALVVLNRIAFFDESTGKLHDGGKRALIRWACERQLGQEPDLVAAVARRRAVALRALSAGPRSRHCVRLHVRPEWRLAVGLGNNANAHEIGLALHGTYGWPVIPGSALKGLAAAWAVASGVEAADVWRVLGGPRTDVPYPRTSAAEGQHKPPAVRGTVCFLDAIPAGKAVTVEADVLTPHVKPYYDGAATGNLVPPAEYHNPVPMALLTVRGTYAVDLHGSDPRDVGLAAEWLTKAGDELGAGAKTAAGYGYLSVFPAPPEAPG